MESIRNNCLITVNDRTKREYERWEKKKKRTNNEENASGTAKHPPCREYIIISFYILCVK